MKELFDYIFKLDFKSLFITKSNNTFIQFFRYIFVGGVAFLADGGSLFLITTIGVNYLISAIFAFIIGLACNYGLSKLLVFEKLLMVKLTIEGIAFIMPFLGKCTSDLGLIV